MGNSNAVSIDNSDDAEQIGLSCYCRIREIKATTDAKNKVKLNSQNLGDYNVNPHISNTGEHFIFSFRGKESMNKDTQFHAAFFADRAQEFYFRLRYALEEKTRPDELDSLYLKWFKEHEDELEAKSKKND